MITLGNFFFKYRNILFIFLYLLLFIPSPQLFSQSYLGPNWFLFPVVIGLLITILGELIRGGTIGLAYIIRGGKEGKIYAEGLVTEGIFNHCRNPLYTGNILMLLGVGILSNSLIYVLVVMPLFILIYHSIVLAEENYLQNKFEDSYNSYCKTVNRWIPSLKNLSQTFQSMQFKWKRWLLKEYGTLYIWLTGITLILLFKYPQITDYDKNVRNVILGVVLSILLLLYLFVRYLKKSGKLRE